MLVAPHVLLRASARALLAGLLAAPLAGCNDARAPRTRGVAPAFTGQPADASVVEPATATFAVTATGTPAPSLQWQSSSDGGATWGAIAGATATTYTTPATSAAQSGTRFRAIATNAAGSATSNAATLTVSAANAAPTITQQPASANVAGGGTAGFSVLATGSPAPTYQWQRRPAGGTFSDIPGATGASYTTPPVAAVDDDGASDDGSEFRVVVTNAQGSATSLAVPLTVTPSALTGFAQISAGNRHVVALRTDGSVWAWGSNGYGQVGRACATCVPRAVAGLSGTFTRVLASGDTSFALRDDGRVFSWGFNGSGQLGRNVAAGTNSATPGAVLRASDGLPLADIVGITMNGASSFGGDASVLAWTAAGVAWKWGHAYVEPGLGGYPNTLFLAAVPHGYFDGSSAARSVASAVAGGTGIVLAVDGAGTAVYWASDPGGTSAGTTAVAPLSALGFNGTAIDFAVADTRLAIVRSDGTLWGQAYQLGGGGAIVWAGLNQPLVQLATPGPVARVAIGALGSVTAALGTDGSVYVAGADANGQLGDGSAGAARTAFAAAAGIDDATDLAAGYETALASRASSAVWGWGNATSAQNGTTDAAGVRLGAPGFTALDATPFPLTAR